MFPWFLTQTGQHSCLCRGHPISHPHRRAMEHQIWVFWNKFSCDNATCFYWISADCWGTSWWLHAMEMLSTLLALCEGIHWSPVDPPLKGSRMQVFDIFFDVQLNKLLNKQLLLIWDATISLQNKIWNLPDRSTILPKFIYGKEGKLARPTPVLPVRVHGPALILRTVLCSCGFTLMSPWFIEVLKLIAVF